MFIPFIVPKEYDTSRQLLAVTSTGKKLNLGWIIAVYIWSTCTRLLRGRGPNNSLHMFSRPIVLTLTGNHGCELLRKMWRTTEIDLESGGSSVVRYIYNLVGLSLAGASTEGELSGRNLRPIWLGGRIPPSRGIIPSDIWVIRNLLVPLCARTSVEWVDYNFIKRRRTNRQWQRQRRQSWIGWCRRRFLWSCCRMEYSDEVLGWYIFLNLASCCTSMLSGYPNLTILYDIWYFAA
jgi:hypothetical protein